MNITVEYSSFLRQHTGLPAERIEVDDDVSLEQLLIHLAEKYGEPFRSCVLDEVEEPLFMILIAVNDRVVNQSEKCVLQAGDRVTLLSPISGG